MQAPTLHRPGKSRPCVPPEHIQDAGVCQILNIHSSPQGEATVKQKSYIYRKICQTHIHKEYENQTFHHLRSQYAAELPVPQCPDSGHQGQQQVRGGLYNFDGSELRAGKSKYSEVLYNWDGRNIRKGSSIYGSVLYNFDGKYFRKGDSKYSEVLFNWDGQYIRQGQSPYNEVLYNFDGTNLRAGRSQYSTILFNVSGKLPAALLIFLLM